jgi:hypothetical protein
MAKPKLLNVKKHLEFEVWAIDNMLKRNSERNYLCPFDLGMLTEIRFFAQAILRKHAAKNTRKDVYVSNVE